MQTGDVLTTNTGAVLIQTQVTSLLQSPAMSLLQRHTKRHPTHQFLRRCDDFTDVHEA